jgi:hypothetical protein
MFSWFLGDYSELHRGASGGTTDPDGDPQLTGASHATAGEIDGVRRNAYSLVPGAGQAATVPREIDGVQVSDAGHNTVLDGHQDSQIASHPDGQFAQNTAATSNHSLSANFELFKTYGFLGSPLDFSDHRGEKRAQAPLPTGSFGLTQRVPLSNLSAARSQRLSDQPYLDQAPYSVKDASESPNRRFYSNLMSGWQVPQVALLGLGIYAAYSMF